MPESLVVSVDEILSTEYPPQEFIIGPSLLPRGGCMLLGAATGVGKSWVALHIAQCLVTGRPLFDAHYHKNGTGQRPKYTVDRLDKVLYIDYELQHSSRKSRLQTDLPPGLGLYFPRNPSLYGMDDERFVRLHDLVKETRPNLLVLDPLSSAHVYEENTSQIKQALNRIDLLRVEYGMAVLIVHHATSKIMRDKESKEVFRKPIEMFRGHSSIVDWADLALALYPYKQRDTDEEGTVEPTKTLHLAFAKTRYADNRKPIKIDINFASQKVTENLGI